MAEQVTLKLVTDNGVVIELNATGLAEDLHRMADDLEADASTVITITLGDGWTQTRVFGQPVGAHWRMGIFEAAKFDALREIIEDEE